MRITEKRLRSIIRSVIKESIGHTYQMEKSLASAINSCEERCGDINFDFESQIKEFILQNHARELESSNTSGLALDTVFPPDSDTYKNELYSRSTEEDYDHVLSMLEDDQYLKVIDSCCSAAGSHF